MKQITSFTIDHMKLLPGIYVSRKDRLGKETITTFDLRMTRPNHEDVMLTGEIHTIEHLGASYLRNHKEYADKIIYFGPMGCRTGFYLILAGDYSSKDITQLVTDMYQYIHDFNGHIPGASAVECGNYTDMNLATVKHLAKRYLDEVLYKIDDERLNYPS